MLFFYAWVVFLAAIILSVPIVYLTESSRNKKARQAASPAGDELTGGDGDEMVDEVAEEIPDEMDDFGGQGPVGEDDFSAFEQEFK
jgi:hypothetical protein